MSQELNWLLLLIVGVVIGAVVAWFFAKTRFSGTINLLESEKRQLDSQLSKLQPALEERDRLLHENIQYSAQLEQKLENLQELSGRLQKLDKEYREVAIEKENLNVLLAEQRTAFAKAEEKHTEAQGEIEKLNEKFTKEFENLANKILD
jgi:DNA recombination protein RmuC